MKKILHSITLDYNVSVPDGDITCTFQDYFEVTVKAFIKVAHAYQFALKSGSIRHFELKKLKKFPVSL